jgi:hypothetical protein
MNQHIVKVATPCVIQPATRMVLVCAYEGFGEDGLDGVVHETMPVVGLLTYPLLLLPYHNSFDMFEQSPRVSALVVSGGTVVEHDDTGHFPDRDAVRLVACPWPEGEDESRLAGDIAIVRESVNRRLRLKTAERKGGAR